MKYILITLLTFNIFAHHEEKDAISVNGECNKKLSPDRFRVEFRVEVTNKSQQKSTSKANSIYAALKKEIQKINPKDLELNTSTYNVNPEYEWAKNKRIYKGFKTTLGLTVVSSEMEKSGEIINVGNKVSVNNIQGPNPFVALTTFQKKYRECLSKAAEDARNKADMLAKSLGVSLGKAIQVNETNFNAYQPSRRHAPRMMMKSESAMADSAPDIEFGKQSLNVKLNVKFSIR